MLSKAPDDDLLVFLVSLIIFTHKIHHALFRNVSGSSNTPLNLARFPFGSRDPFLILWVASIDGGGVNVLVVVCLQTKEALVLGKLIPGAAGATGFLQRPVSLIACIGYPRLQVPFVAETRIGDGSVSPEGGPVA